MNSESGVRVGGWGKGLVGRMATVSDVWELLKGLVRFGVCVASRCLLVYAELTCNSIVGLLVIMCYLSLHSQVSLSLWHCRSSKPGPSCSAPLTQSPSARTS